MDWRKRIASIILDGATLFRKILNHQLGILLIDTKADVIIDVGGASGDRYRTLVDHSMYWTFDIQEAHKPSVVSDASLLPVTDAVADLLLCIQVLEHCMDPRTVIEEMHRVLKPGGTLVLSTVLLYELHGSPDDYYRFTDSALRSLTAQFLTVDVIPMGNRFVAVYDLTVARSLVLNSILGRIAYTFASSPSIECPCGYILVARKAD
jgi:ubiquinone/menaquinone biosynthesis C-methylase UbiE